MDNGNFNSKINLSLYNNHKNNINSDNNIKINNDYDVEMNDNIEILSTIGKELNIDLGNTDDNDKWTEGKTKNLCGGMLGFILLFLFISFKILL